MLLVKTLNTSLFWLSGRPLVPLLVSIMATEKDHDTEIFLEISTRRTCGHIVGSGYQGICKSQEELHENINGLVKMIDQKVNEPCDLCERAKNKVERTFYLPEED